MNPENFLDNFGHITDASGGIDTLRRLILSLAVRGRLTHQDSNEEPAVELLERISTERDRMVKAKAIRRPTQLRPVEADEQAFDVPESWVWTRLGDVCQSRLGKMLDDQKNTGNPWPYLRNSNVQWGRFELEDVKRIRLEDSELAEYSLRDGDLLVAEGGEPGRCAIWDSTLAEGAMVFQKALHRVRPDEGISARFIALVLRNGVDSGRLQALFTGTTIKHLTGEKLKSFAVPLPPVEEQHRIAERVGELMGLCDELEERLQRNDLAATDFRVSALQALTEADSREDVAHAWKRLSTNWRVLTQNPESVPALRHAILQLAIQGRVVSQCASDGSASAEVERARAQKTALLGARRQPSIGQAKPHAASLPTGWVWATVDDLFLVTGGIQKTSSRRPRENHYPYMRVANVQRDRLNLNEIEHFELFEGELDRYRLMPGDLLVVEGNGSETEIGRCARWSGEIENCVHQNHLIRCRPLLPGLELYLLLFLNSPAGMATMKRLAVTTSGLYNLSVSKIRSIVFPLPPAGERARIKTRVDDLSRRCDELENGIAKQRDLQRRFTQSSAIDVVNKAGAALSRSLTHVP